MSDSLSTPPANLPVAKEDTWSSTDLPVSLKNKETEADPAVVTSPPSSSNAPASYPAVLPSALSPTLPPPPLPPSFVKKEETKKEFSTIPKKEDSIAVPQFRVRTMESDLASAQKGHLPLKQIVKLPTSSLSAVDKNIPLPSSLSSASGSFKVPVGPEIKLGKTQKRTSLFSRLKGALGGQKYEKTGKEIEVQISGYSPAPLPAPRVETKRPSSLPPSVLPPGKKPMVSPVPLPPRPSVVIPPVLPPRPAPASKVIQSPPPKHFSFIGFKTIIIVVVLAVTGVVLWLVPNLFVSPESDEIAKFSYSPTPSPLPVVTPTPSPIFLAEVFNNFAPVTIKAGTLTAESLSEQLLPLLTRYAPDNILLVPQDSMGEKTTFSEFFNALSIDFPINILSYIDENDFYLVLSKQTEKFEYSTDSKNGRLIDNSNPFDWRLALAVRIKDSQMVRSLLDNWEDSMSDNFSRFYQISADREIFLDNVYKEIPIRYKNFPLPDHSLDYALIAASNYDDYLIIANSREQTYSIIDVLMAF